MNKHLFFLAFAFLLTSCGGKATDSTKAAEADKPVIEESSTTPEAPQNKAKEALAPEATKDEAATEQPAPEGVDPAQSAKKAIKQFAGELKAELVGAMKSGGPVNAIDVCNKKAASIAEKVSKEQGVTLSRVSMKNRSPVNAPNEWQIKVLEEFEARKQKGDDIKKIAFGEVAEVDGKKEFRFMKAIPTGEICLKCHGAEIAPEVEAKIAELYPDDKAKGYKVGDIRGAFVVRKEL